MSSYKDLESKSINVKILFLDQPVRSDLQVRPMNETHGSTHLRLNREQSPS